MRIAWLDGDTRGGYDRRVSGLHCAVVMVLLALSVGPCAAAPEAPEVATVPLVLLLPIPEVCEDVPIVESCDPEPCCAGARFDELRAEVAAECAAMGGQQLQVGAFGCVAHCALDDGREHGPVVKWYNSGSLRGKMYYRDGKPNGLARTWHENGQLSTEVWRGRPGCSRRWSTDGQLIVEDCD